MNLGIIFIWMIAFILSVCVIGIAAIIVAKIVKIVTKMFSSDIDK